jgi:hypothetical protein
MKRHSPEAQGYADMDLQVALPVSDQSMDVDARNLKRPRGRDLAVVEYETPALKRQKESSRKRGREEEGKSARKHLRFTYPDDYDDDEL